MKLLINLLIIVAIIGLAVWVIIRTFKKVKTGGKCAACDCDCELKQLKNRQTRQHLTL